MRLVTVILVHKYSTLLLAMCFVLSVHCCKDSACSLKGDPLISGFGVIDYTSFTAFKAEVTSNMERMFPGKCKEILGMGFFQNLVKTKVKRSWAIHAHLQRGPDLWHPLQDVQSQWTPNTRVAENRDSVDSKGLPSTGKVLRRV